MYTNNTGSGVILLIKSDHLWRSVAMVPTSMSGRKSRTLELLAFDEKSTFDFPALFGGIKPWIKRAFKS
jgi:hypothetical protein